MSNYTKGPWEVRVGGNFVDIWSSGHSFQKDGLPSQFKIGESNYRQSDDGSSTRGQAIANAKLIACAPEMAEMLLSMVSHVSHGGPTRAEAEALLKKSGVIE